MHRPHEVIRTLQKYKPERRFSVVKSRMVRGKVDQMATAANEMKTLYVPVSLEFRLARQDGMYVHHHPSVWPSSEVLERSETQHHLDAY